MAALLPTSRLSTNYDVFISFRGEDTRYEFTGFLDRYLKRLGINVYMDDEDLRLGEEIGPKLGGIIQQSKIFIIVLSKYYAESKWCLQELLEIVECHKTHDGQIILPIFFDVEPSDVRHQRGSFEHSFDERMRRFDEITIRHWKEALRAVADVRGLDVRRENRDLSTVVELIVNSVSTLLNGQSGVNYDVFLSFRGVDTRNNFTAFLHRELKRVGINVFMDNEGLWVGEEIKPVLLEAIQRSKVSIIVFSERYADSKWCLLELADVVRCHRSNGQKILPIFLNVKPTDVRDLTGFIETSFQKHKDRFDSETIESWKDALKVVGGEGGIELQQVNGSEPS